MMKDSCEKIRIVARRNGVGLDRDVELIKSVLPEGCQIEDYHSRSLKSVFEAIGGWFQDSEAEPINVLIERVPLAWTVGPGTTVLIPNQERFPKRHLARLRVVKRVFCKSRHADQIFRELGIDTRFIGFTSNDRNLTDPEPDYRQFLHLAGASTLKGTEVLLSLWAKHPEWPSLTLIQRAHNAPAKVPHNVQLLTEYLDDGSLQRLQNQHGIHICPSLSEGWGHYIVEGMSCAAVVLTTDAPPMNELVNDSRGILVPWSKSYPRNLGTNFAVDPAALEAAIEMVIKSDSATLAEKGNRARQWFEQNERDFRIRCREAFIELRAA
jgi:glycosyltransferase involved in cell wall biosynthesis